MLFMLPTPADDFLKVTRGLPIASAIDMQLELAKALDLDSDEFHEVMAKAVLVLPFVNQRQSVLTAASEYYFEGDLLSKAAGNKYLRRILTGKVKPKYRYIYTLNSKGHGKKPAVGEKIRVKHGETDGHYEVHKVDGDTVHVKHDETGHAMEIHKDKLHDLFTAGHSEKVERKLAALEKVNVAAQKFGTTKQKKNAADALTDFKDLYDLGTKEAPAPADETPGVKHGEIGKHIFGSRKDFFGGGQLEDLAPKDQAKLITKKNLMPRPSVQDLRDQGKTAGGAAMHLAVLDSIGAKAPDNTADRLQYMEGVRVLSHTLNGLKTVDDFNEWRHEFTLNMMNAGKRTVTLDEMKAQAEKLGVPLATEETPRNLARQLNRYASKTGDHWGWTETGAEYASVDEKRNATRLYTSLGSRFIKTVANAELHKTAEVPHAFRVYAETRKSADSKQWAKSESAARALSRSGNGWDTLSEAEAPTKKTKGTKTTKPRKTKYELQRSKEMPVRKGGKEIHGHADGQRMVDTFGFRNVDHGNWMTQRDREYHLSQAEGAFHDLADIIGLDPNLISANGKLGIHFGARGRAGAVAHYEAQSKVINMTKMNGAGALAHEWGHFLDNILASPAEGDKAGSSVSHFLSDGRLDPTPTQRAMDRVMDAILYSDVTQADLPRLKEERDALQEAESAAAVALTAATTVTQNSTPKELAAYEKIARTYSEANKARKKAHRDIGNLRIGEKIRSRFYTDAQDLDASSGRKKPYMTEPTELFARAFEHYVEAKLRASGRGNTYLVSGTQLDSSGAPAPYPQSGESKRIHAAMEKFLQHVDKGGHLAKAIAVAFAQPNNKDNSSMNNFTKFIITGEQDEMAKGADHKYLRRVLTGKTKPKYNYVYSVSSSKHAAHPKVGEKVRMDHNGQKGHYEITHDHGDGHISVKHDETGHTMKVKKDKLHDLFHKDNAKAVQTKLENLKRTHAQAQKTGTEKQKAKAKKDLDSFHDVYDLPKDKAPTQVKAPVTAAQREARKRIDAHRKKKEGERKMSTLDAADAKQYQAMSAKYGAEKEEAQARLAAHGPKAEAIWADKRVKDAASYVTSGTTNGKPAILVTDKRNNQHAMEIQGDTLFPNPKLSKKANAAIRAAWKAQQPVSMNSAAGNRNAPAGLGLSMAAIAGKKKGPTDEQKAAFVEDEAAGNAFGTPAALEAKYGLTPAEQKNAIRAAAAKESEAKWAKEDKAKAAKMAKEKTPAAQLAKKTKALIKEAMPEGPLGMGQMATKLVDAVPGITDADARAAIDSVLKTKMKKEKADPKVAGHTKTGKAIPHHPGGTKASALKAYEGWSKEDHRDAAELMRDTNMGGYHAKAASVTLGSDAHNSLGYAIRNNKADLEMAQRKGNYDEAAALARQHGKKALATEMQRKHADS